MRKEEIRAIPPGQVVACRKAMSMSQKQFAEMAGISNDKLRKRWEVRGLTVNQVKEASAVLSCLVFDDKKGAE